MEQHKYLPIKTFINQALPFDSVLLNTSNWIIFFFKNEAV